MDRLGRGANVTTLDVFADPKHQTLAKAMLRLRADRDAGTIRNEFGGQVKVVAKNGEASLIYTNVPATIHCSKIPHVVCEH